LSKIFDGFSQTEYFCKKPVEIVEFVEGL